MGGWPAGKFLEDQVKYSNDEVFLKKIATSRSSSYVKEIAVKKIHDQKFLYEFILRSKAGYGRVAAANNITEPALKKRILDNLNFNATLFCIFIDDIQDDHDMVYRCLENVRDESVFKNVVPKIKSKILLFRLKECFEDILARDKDDIGYKLRDIIDLITNRIEEIPSSLDFITGTL